MFRFCFRYRPLGHETTTAAQTRGAIVSRATFMVLGSPHEAAEVDSPLNYPQNYGGIHDPLIQDVAGCRNLGSRRSGTHRVRHDGHRW
ncbi:hypothetical protein NOCA1160099 [metagenome]|uniref:Uncharacterized protein n=1 Tax=metagenome TaxID=256318 RepID=A0A2P2CA76_9ZZZZ